MKKINLLAVMMVMTLSFLLNGCQGKGKNAGSPGSPLDAMNSDMQNFYSTLKGSTLQKFNQLDDIHRKRVLDKVKVSNPMDVNKIVDAEYNDQMQGQGQQPATNPPK